MFLLSIALFRLRSVCAVARSFIQLVHTTDRNSRPTDNRFIRELRGALTITNAMLEDDGKWLCQARNAQGYVENARPVKLVVLGTEQITRSGRDDAQYARLALASGVMPMRPGNECRERDN